MYIFREDIKLWKTKSYYMCSLIIEDDALVILDWKNGKKKLSDINSNLLPLQFLTDVKVEPSDFVQNSIAAFFLGNDKAKACLVDQIKQNAIELIPSKIINKKLNKEYNYWIFNVINVKNIIDVKYSMVSKYSSHLRPSFLKLKLNQKAISDNQDIYYDPNMLGEYIISDRLAEKIKKANLTGMEVIPIEKYTDKFYKE